MPAGARRWSTRTRAVPADDSTCGWLPEVAAPRLIEPLDRHLLADAVVIGAGFGGLAAARRFAELLPGPVALLEAQRAGFGAAGRSSGFLVDRATFVANMEPDHAERYVRLARWALGWLEGQVAQHGIDCDWDDRGWIQAASGEEGLRALAELAAWLRQRGEPIEELDRGDLERIVGVDFYRQGVRLPGTVLVNAAKLVTGLAATLPDGVQLYERSPVRRIVGDGQEILVEAGTGSIRTPRVVVAVNGYSSSLGLLRQRIAPLYTYGSLTRPLTAEEQMRLGGEREWGVLAQDPMGSSLRRTRGQRILVRNSVRFPHGLTVSSSQRRSAFEANRVAFEARFPDLADVPFEHSWAGLMGVTPSQNHFFGELQEGLFACAGFTGAGIVMGSACGRLLADLACGRSSQELEDMQSLPGPTWLGPSPFREIGARVKTWRMNASAGPAL